MKLEEQVKDSKDVVTMDHVSRLIETKLCHDTLDVDAKPIMHFIFYF